MPKKLIECCASPGSDQCRVGQREVYPPRAPVHPAICGGPGGPWPQLVL